MNLNRLSCKLIFNNLFLIYLIMLNLCKSYLLKYLKLTVVSYFYQIIILNYKLNYFTFKENYKKVIDAKYLIYKLNIVHCVLTSYNFLQEVMTRCTTLYRTVSSLLLLFPRIKYKSFSYRFSCL